MQSLSKLVFGALTAVAAGAVGATQSIDTHTGWNGSMSMGPFGEPDTATFGQSITTDDAGGLLQSFTFYLEPLDLDIRAYVFQWDGMKTVGSALFASQTFNIGASFSGFKAVTVSTDGLKLGANTQYALVFSSSGIQAEKYNTNNWAVRSTNVYSGGEFIFHNSGNDINSLGADFGWDCGDGCGFMGNGADLVFKAQIDALPPVGNVPEPGTYALLLAGLALVGTAARRSRA